MVGFSLWVIGIIKNDGYFIAIVINYAGPVNMQAVSRSQVCKTPFVIHYRQWPLLVYDLSQKVDDSKHKRKNIRFDEYSRLNSTRRR